MKYVLLGIVLMLRSGIGIESNQIKSGSQKEGKQIPIEYADNEQNIWMMDCRIHDNNL